MSKLPLDLSKFRKIKSDKNTSVLQHPGGHSITIAHNALSPELKKSLDKIPLHGQKMARGGAVHKYADGASSVQPDELEQIENEVAETPPSQSNIPPQDESYAQHAGDIVRQSIGSTVGGLADVARPIVSGVKDFSRGLFGQSQPQQGPPVADSGQIATDSGAQSEEMPSNEDDDTGQTQAAPVQQPGQMPPQPQQQSMTPQQIFAASHGSSKAILNQDDQQLMKEFQSGQIKPENYATLFGDKSTPGKIASVFGLLLGGMGGGLTHQGNPVTQMWDKQISNDMQRQMANQQNQNSFLSIAHQGMVDRESIAHQQLTDYQSAVDFARKQTNIAALHNLTTIVGSTDPNTPQGQDARQKLAMASQYVNSENANLNDAIAAKKAYFDMMGGGGSGGSQDPAIALRQKQMMGFINPEQYTQGNKEIAMGQEAEKLRGDLISSYNDLNNSLLGGAFSPERRESDINAFAGRLAKISEGRFNLEESKKQIGSILPARLPFQGQTNIRKMQNLNALIDGQINTPTLNGLGIQIPRAQTQAQGQGQPQYKMSGGKKYVRGPHGEAIPVS